MKITFDISDDKINNFSSGARSELKSQCNKAANNIVDEACRIEASRRIDTATDSEVTKSDVKDAANFSRRVFRKKKSIMAQIIQIVASVSSLFTGGLFTPDKFNDKSTIFWFLAVGLIAVISTVYLVLNQE